jgi:hypothetical protein
MLSDSVRSPLLHLEGASSCDNRLSMLDGWIGRPLGADCIGDALDRVPFIFAVFPCGSRDPFSLPGVDLS